MTPSPDTLQSNRELDAEIARLVMGFTGVREVDGKPVRDVRESERPFLADAGYAPPYIPIEFYSSDWNAMGKVVEKMRERFGNLDILFGDGVSERVICVIRRCTGERVAQGEAGSAPLAVARAAVAQEVK